MKETFILDNRIKTYNYALTILSNLSDEELDRLLLQSAPFHQSKWRSCSSVLHINDTQVFVKRIPLTDLELLQENTHCTQNYFDLPLYYQYGVGSAGFGVWRELASHLMANNWVLSGACASFPLLYHWSILNGDHPVRLTEEESKQLELDVAYWEGSNNIRERLIAAYNASAYMVLFLEYIPQNLYQWLSSELTSGKNTERAIAMVDSALQMVTDFMRSQDFIHFDAHFENILTDGKQLYFSDFGLSLSKSFDLSREEISFFESHRTYDRCSAIVNLLHCLVTSALGKDRWERWLKEPMSSKCDGAMSEIKPIVQKYSAITGRMDEFYQALIKDSKLTHYPADTLDKLLGEIL